MTRTIELMLLIASLGAAGVACAQSQVRVETFSGSGQAGLADSDGRVGQFNRPHGLAIDGKGNVYVSDRGNHAIRVVATNGDIRNPDGLTKTIEGNIVQGVSRTLWEEVRFDQKNVKSAAGC